MHIWGRGGGFGEGPVVWRPLTRSPCQHCACTPTNNCLNPFEALLPSFIPNILINPFGPRFVRLRVQTWREIRGHPGRWPWPLRGASFVVSQRGSAPLWRVQFLIGSEASQRPDASRYCPVASEKPASEKAGVRRGQTGHSAPSPFKRHRYPPSFWAALRAEHPPMNKHGQRKATWLWFWQKHIWNKKRDVFVFKNQYQFSLAKFTKNWCKNA